MFTRAVDTTTHPVAEIDERARAYEFKYTFSYLSNI